MLTHAFGRCGLAVYLVLDEQREVHILRIAAPCAASTSRSPRPQCADNGQAPVKRVRFIKLSGPTKSVNTELVEKAKALAGLKDYITISPPVRGPLVVVAYGVGADDRRSPLTIDPARAHLVSGKFSSSR
ncbi:hypothetical protein [Microbispora triticiradicis]|uniref:hypothetical protein n=1 Tax=Microbispora triticiradicis TaxID=2200763 RepID=UPI001AD64400